MSSAHTERLDELLKANTTADRAEIKAALSRLLAELRERNKRGSSQSLDFFANAVRVLSRIKGKIHSDVRMECLFTCINFYYHEGLQARALESAKQLLDLASASGNLIWVRKAHTAVGIALADMGNTGEALEHHARAMELSIQTRDEAAQSLVLSNTAVALNYAGLYREAIPCLQRAVLLAHGLPELRSKARTNLAQAYLYLEEYREGFRAVELAVAEAPPPTDPPSALSHAIKEFTFVHLALEIGRLDSARKHTKLCAEYARWSDSARGTSLAQIAEGLCEVYGGSVDRGLAILEESLTRSTATDAWRLESLVALVRAYDLAGNPEKALSHMKALLEHIRSQRERALLAFLQLSSEPTLATSGLQALELREARLEARVAERETGWQRIEMVERLAVTADLKEEASGEHGYRVGRLSSLLASTLSWATDDANALDLAARLHDIGKIAVPDRILLNSEELQAAERHFMSTHTTIGAELLAKSNIPQLRMAEEIARHHHEWWNGEGYPSKLKGKRIPIHARIVALADVFDALTHGRPFAEPWSMDKAVEEIRSRRGTQFDPELTDLFLDLIARLRKEHQDLDEYLGRAGRNSPFLMARNKIRMMLAEERDSEKKATVEGNATRH